MDKKEYLNYIRGELSDYLDTSMTMMGSLTVAQRALGDVKLSEAIHRFDEILKFAVDDMSKQDFGSLESEFRETAENYIKNKVLDEVVSDIAKDIE